MSITKKCSHEFHARQSSGIRSLSQISLVVLHVAESSNARNVARDFSTTTREASAHLVVGQSSCYRCLKDMEIPEAAIGANLIGIHIEHAGFAAWSRAEWLKHDMTLRRGAYKAAHICHRYQLGTRFLTATDLINGHHRGITTHHEVNLWQIHLDTPGDHSHTCPGVTFPLDRYASHIARYHRQIRSGTR